MLLYFSLSLFVSATLLFLVQPMIGKMILPQLGGTPAVWNTCMVFFQGVLLVGYGYTHLLTTTQSTRRQLLIQGCLLLLPFLVLPFSLGNWTPETESNPIFDLLLKLTIMVGLPFLMVSTTAPLLQKWFSQTGHRAAKDPYFLYGASNFGSMLGLALYPTVVEPWLQVAAAEGESTWRTQVHLWTFGYSLFVALVVGCAVVVWIALSSKFAAPVEMPPAPPPEPTPPPPAEEPATATAITAAPKRRKGRLVAAPTAPTPTPAPTIKAETFTRPGDDVTIWRRLRWIGLAAAPSSLMLGVTTYMTTDIAAVTYFWIIPLMLYLLTFIIVFARWPVVWTGTPHTVVLFLQPMFLLFIVLVMNSPDITPPTWASFLLHLGAFFSTTLMCHGELARDRPSTKYLTEFYFWMSLGGVLGGLFNALFAPIVFQYGLWEFPITMAFACLLRPNLVDSKNTLIPGDSSAARPTILGTILDFKFPILIGTLCFLATYYLPPHKVPFLLQRKFMVAGLVVGCLAMSLRPVRFGLAVAALYVAVGVYDRLDNDFIYERRGFFGLLRVRESPLVAVEFPQIDEPQVHQDWKQYRTLIHGGINHGRQIVAYKDVFGRQNPAMTLKKRREPITYFHERNGVAELFYKLCWPNAQPPTEVINMTGASDARLPAAMFGLACGESAPWGMLVNTQSEPPFAVVGLGTGILACYAKPYQHVDFYEIDPLVKGLSIVPGYVPPWDPERKLMPKLPDPTFFYIHDAQERWANINVKLGDGRLILKKAPDKYYHIIALDAFSSDAIPVHLLTTEAVELYLDKLAEGGVLLFNTTNRYVHIERVLAAIAEELDCDCLYCPDTISDTFDHPDRFGADWVVLQARVKSLGARLESVRGKAGLTVTWVRVAGPMDHAELPAKLRSKRVENHQKAGRQVDHVGLEKGDSLLEIEFPERDPKEPKKALMASDRLADLLADCKSGETVKFLVKPHDWENTEVVTVTVPTAYATGGMPIRQRLYEQRLRLAWNGRVLLKSEGAEEAWSDLALNTVGVLAAPMQPGPMIAASALFPGRANEKIEQRWQEIAPLPGPVWTDGYSNLLNPQIMPWLTPWRK